MRIDHFYFGRFAVNLVLIGIFVLNSRSIAVEPDDGTGKEMEDRWKLVFDEMSKKFQVNRNGAPLTDLRKSTVLSLWNPNSVPNPRLGRVYLWTEQGRPVVIGTIMTGTGFGFREVVNIIYEFHSLDSKPIQVEHREVLLDCPTEGIKWLPLEGDPSPNSSPVHRMRQMREIARSFQVTGTAVDKDTNIFALLPNPIYRYENETSLATDGAIFAFGTATDPFVYILMEARNNEWWVAFARSSVATLKIERNNQLFYEFAKIDKTSEKSGGTPFYIDWIGARRSASSPETEYSILK